MATPKIRLGIPTITLHPTSATSVPSMVYLGILGVNQPVQYPNLLLTGWDGSTIYAGKASSYKFYSGYKDFQVTVGYEPSPAPNHVQFSFHGATTSAHVPGSLGNWILFDSGRCWIVVGAEQTEGTFYCKDNTYSYKKAPIEVKF